MEEYFVDKKGQTIFIEADYNGIITAYYNGNEIGLFIYDRTEYGDDYSSYDSYSLDNMNINSKFRRRGIGTKMIALGESFFEKVSYPEIGSGRNEAHYADEGLQLILSCIDKGIIDKKNFFEIED